jgi:antitoxin FitA
MTKMAMLTVRNITDEVHRALRVLAAKHGHSMAAEVREILQSAVIPAGRVRLGSLLANMGRQARLTEQEFAVFVQVRDKPPRGWAEVEGQTSTAHEPAFKNTAAGSNNSGTGHSARAPLTNRAVSGS